MPLKPFRSCSNYCLTRSDLHCKFTKCWDILLELVLCKIETISSVGKRNCSELVCCKFVNSYNNNESEDAKGFS